MHRYIKAPPVQKWPLLLVGSTDVDGRCGAPCDSAPVPCDSAPVPCDSVPVPCDSPPAPGTYDMYILRPPKCPLLRGTYDMYILRPPKCPLLRGTYDMYILRVRMRERYILRPPKFVRMRARVRIRVHVTGGVLARGLTCVGPLSEQPHWRWPK